MTANKSEIENAKSTLMLLMSAGKEQYGLDAREVVNVVPMIPVREIPHTPEYVAGIFSYRGVSVPVIDLCRLTRGTSCRRRLSTRTVLVNYPGKGEASHILGLLAERVTAMAEVNEGDLAPPNIKADEAPYLGDIIAGKRGVIQRLELHRLLPESVRDSLFQDEPGKE